MTSTMSTLQNNIITKELRISPLTNQVKVCRTCTNNRNGFCRAGNMDADLMYDMPLARGGCGQGLKYNVASMEPEVREPESYKWR